MLDALRDPVWQVREEAATTLGKPALVRDGADAANPAAIGTALMAALDDSYWQVRLRAARSLGRLKYGGALPALLPVLTHTISNLRKEAALALGELGDAAALPALEPVAADPDLSLIHI